MTTNGSGDILAARHYDSWGAVLDSEGARRFDFGFTAREEELVGSLYFYRTRYYSPSMGRFLSEDGLRALHPVFGGAVYSYADNAPTMYDDPFGLKTTCKTGTVRSWKAIVDTDRDTEWRLTGIKTWNYMDFLAKGPPSLDPAVKVWCLLALMEQVTTTWRHYQTLWVRCRCPTSESEIDSHSDSKTTTPWYKIADDMIEAVINAHGMADCEDVF